MVRATGGSAMLGGEGITVGGMGVGGVEGIEGWGFRGRRDEGGESI